jgi:hypothetical protein
MRSTQGLEDFLNLRPIAALTLVGLLSLTHGLVSARSPMSESIAYASIRTSSDESVPGVRADSKDKDKSKNDNKDDKSDNKNDNTSSCTGQDDDNASSVMSPSSLLASLSAGAGPSIMLKDTKAKDKKSSDKDKNDNKDDQNDNEDDSGASCPGSDDVASATTPATMPTGTLPMTEVTGTSTGGDSTVTLIDERVVLRIFPWMPSGITFKMRFVDPGTVSSPPGKRVGNMVFRVEAQDASGKVLDVLPAEANLSARYADRDVDGAKEQDVTLSRLDPATNQWKAAPKITRAAENNYIAASIMEPGTYAINIP